MVLLSGHLFLGQSNLKQNSHTSAAWKMYCKCCHAIGSCLRRDKVFDNVMGTMKTW